MAAMPSNSRSGWFDHLCIDAGDDARWTCHASFKGRIGDVHRVLPHVHLTQPSNSDF
ncbi:hypothetical protein L210DRAFT_3560959 [Boletus edulis BED1]|uniref:Uncharacterized protein n=1 Tax=Boletus edulis BED1 TaxID=1328754 RepID=A0AAD4BIC5_BOLED|nr:hypothetical protein L210DRAFT_3593531 [Boletus edulis BED1]KAF8431172.1 hypothetical protein L210DRAFT_3560959 [Boletus edulis BED1]